MCTGRRHKTLGSKTKNCLLLIAIAVARVSAYMNKYTKPQSAQGLNDICTCSLLNYRGGTWNLKNLDL